MDKHFSNMSTGDETDAPPQVKLTAVGAALTVDLDAGVDQVGDTQQRRHRKTAVRQAIGQLFDNRRHTIPTSSSLAIVLPSEASSDLVDLAHSLGIACVYETTEGRFDRREPPTSPQRRRQHIIHLDGD